MSGALDLINDDLLALCALRVISGQEHKAGAILALRRQYQLLLRAGLDEEFVRHLNKNTRSVTGQRVGARCAAMGKAVEERKPLAHDLV